MAGTATLTQAPRTRDGVRTARVKLGDSGYPATARIHDRPGEHYPYGKGDVVTVRTINGDPAAGVIITGIYGSDPSPLSGNNREIHARNGDMRTHAPNGDNRVTAKDLVRLGDGDDGDQKAVAINEEVEVDTTSVQAQLDQFIDIFLTAIDPSPATLTAVTAAMGAVIPGWTQLKYIGTPLQRAPVAKPARNTVAAPEEVI